jgi:hypothetical protein
MTHVMTVHHKPDAETEIHMLNPGEHFPGFGGSRSGLVVGKTASMILREKSSWGIRDVEYDIHDQTVWEWIAGRINDREDNAAATAPPRKEATA